MLSNAIDKSREKTPVCFLPGPAPVLVNRVLAAEDSVFSATAESTHSHPERLIIDVREGEATQGASTLTSSS